VQGLITGLWILIIIVAQFIFGSRESGGKYLIKRIRADFLNRLNQKENSPPSYKSAVTISLSSN
jgi:hypothetical protein